MDDGLLLAYVAGGFSLAGILIGQSLSTFNSWLDYRRQERVEQARLLENEEAVLHGAFAATNFIAARLNDWDASRNIFDLTRLAVVQPYIAKLIDRSPLGSDRLMVSLIDLGLKLEASQFLVGLLIGETEEFSIAQVEQIEGAVAELSVATELVQLLVDGELPMMSEEDLAEIAPTNVNDIAGEETAGKG